MSDAKRPLISTGLYQSAFQLSKGIILILDQDGMVVSFNEILESITGYSYAELTHSNWFDLLIPKKDKAAAKRYFRRFILKGRASGKVITELEARNGKACFVEWYYQPLENQTASGDGEGVRVLAIGQDVSERVFQERQLLNERTQLIERNKELTCLYSMAKIVARNQPLPQMLESIAAIIPPAFQYPEIATAIIRLDAHAYGASEPMADNPTLSENLVVHELQRGNIKVMYALQGQGQDQTTPAFLDEEHALLRTIAHHLAIAIERKEAIDHKAEMENQLRHSDRLAKIGQLTAGVAHELNEPLGNILGFAQLSAKTDNLSNQVHSDLDNIIKAALHAREIIKKLMFFSRQTPPREMQVNLNRLIEDGMYLFGARCAKNGITVNKSLCNNLPAIKADISQLQQVFTNLVVNAIHAMPNEGELNIETIFDRQAVYLIVTDSGVGMAEETLKQIFLPFFTTKDVKQGTGLGLSVAHGIVRAHGGDIEVESRIGHGTKFKICFPLKRHTLKDEEG